MFKTIYQIYKALTAISIQILAKDGVEQKKMLDLFGTEENVGPLWNRRKCWTSFIYVRYECR